MGLSNLVRQLQLSSQTGLATSQGYQNRRTSYMNISMLVSIDMEMGLPYGSYGYEKSLQRYLWSKKRVIPERYMGVMDVYDEAQLHERLSELARVRLIVIQKDFLRLSERRDLCKEQQQYLTQNFLSMYASAV